MIVAPSYRPTVPERLADMMEAVFGNKILHLHCFNCGHRFKKKHTAKDWHTCPNCQRSVKF